MYNQKKDNREFPGYYKKIEALYYQGYSIDEMRGIMSNLDKITILDCVQRIFGLNMMRKGRS